VAFERMESNAEVACVAAGVHDHTGAMTAAMSISVPVVRWADRTEDEWAKLVTSGAHMLSGRLGARSPQPKP
jgi:DNA-binding IclR family transcriptional regulator